VPVLVQPVPDFRESSPDRAAAAAEQVGEGVVGQAQPQIEYIFGLIPSSPDLVTSQ